MKCYFNRIALSLALLSAVACASLPEHSSSGASDGVVISAGNRPSAFVDKAFLSGKLALLASDSLKGRGTGQPGSAMTAKLLSGFYGDLGFPDPVPDLLRQPFELEGIFWDAVSYDLYRLEEADTLFVSRSHLKKNGGAHFFPIMDGALDHDARVIFTGHALFDSGDGMSRSTAEILENNWALVFEPGPDHERTRGDIIRELTGQYRAFGVIFIPEETTKEWEDRARDLSHQLERPRMIRRPEGRYRASEFHPGTAVSVHPELAFSMLGIRRPDQLDSLRTSLHTRISRPLPEDTGFRFRNTPVLTNRAFKEENIIFVIPGADKRLAHEAVVLTAHYDHMGLGQPDDRDDIVYSGADDNASGTAVLMQLAQAFREFAEQGYRPSRTLVFLHVAAEEWGLFGSRFFVENTPFPDLEIVSNVNVDMVGYVDNIYTEREDQDYIYVIGAGMVSSLLEELLEMANKETSELILDERYNNTSDHLQLYRRSDHWPFAQRNIPFVFFFSGLHDHYHRPSDTAERIDYRLLTERTRLVAELVWYLAEAQEAPGTDRKQLGGSQAPSR